MNDIKKINKEDIIKKFTVASMIYNQKTSVFSYNFPFDKVFETTEDTLKVINDMEHNPYTWHTICPLYVPKEAKNETNLSQCLHFDSVIKNLLFEIKQQSSNEEFGETKIINIEQVYKDNGVDFPK